MFEDFKFKKGDKVRLKGMVEPNNPHNHFIVDYPTFSHGFKAYIMKGLNIGCTDSPIYNEAQLELVD